MNRFSALMVLGLILMVISGCAAIDWVMGVSRDEAGVALPSDPSASPLALITGLLGASNIGTAMAGFYGNAARREYKKMGLTVVSGVSKIRARAKANPDEKITLKEIMDILATEQNANNNRQGIREKLIAPVEHNGGGVPKLGMLG